MSERASIDGAVGDGDGCRDGSKSDSFPRRNKRQGKGHDAWLRVGNWIMDGGVEATESLWFGLLVAIYVNARVTFC